MKATATKAINTCLVWSSVYALGFLVLGAYINYVTPYSAEATNHPALWQIVAWSLLYLPVVILPLVAKRNISDFGFSLSPQLALACILVSMLCASFTNMAAIPWNVASIEAFARTGEEIFFRGFLFDLFLQLLVGKRSAWLWAAIASSVLFALIHTQTLQQPVLSESGYPATSASFIILQRFVNLFGLALVFALLRVVTRSILPGAIAHSMISGGILAGPFVLAIYFLVLFWAYKRGERVTVGISAQAG